MAEARECSMLVAAVAERTSTSTFTTGANLGSQTCSDWSFAISPTLIESRRTRATLRTKAHTLNNSWIDAPRSAGCASFRRAQEQQILRRVVDLHLLFDVYRLISAFLSDAFDFPYPDKSAQFSL